MIEVYTVEKCPKCTIVKGLLNKKQLMFTEIKLETPEQKQLFIDTYKVRTMPYMVVDGTPIGDAVAATDWINKTYGTK